MLWLQPLVTAPDPILSSNHCACIQLNRSCHIELRRWCADKAAESKPEEAKGRGRAIDATAPAVAIDLDARIEGEALSQLEVGIRPASHKPAHMLTFHTNA